MASSRSVVPAMGLLGVTGEQGLGVRSGQLSLERDPGPGVSMQLFSTASPSPPPPHPHALCLLDLRATPVAHPPSFCQQLRALRSWSLAGAPPLPNIHSPRRLWQPTPLTTSHSQAKLASLPCPPFGLFSPLPTCRDLCGLPLLGLGWGGCEGTGEGEPVRLGAAGSLSVTGLALALGLVRGPHHTGALLAPPFLRTRPLGDAVCLGGMVVLGGRVDLALGWGRGRQALCQLWRERMAGALDLD